MHGPAHGRYGKVKPTPTTKTPEPANHQRVQAVPGEPDLDLDAGVTQPFSVWAAPVYTDHAYPVPSRVQTKC